MEFSPSECRRCPNAYERLRTATNAYGRPQTPFPASSQPNPNAHEHLFTLFNTLSHRQKIPGSPSGPFPLRADRYAGPIGCWKLDVECSMFGFHSDFTPISTQSDPIRPTDTNFFCHPCAIRNPPSKNPTCRPKVQPTPTHSKPVQPTPSQSKPVQHAFFTPSTPTPYDRRTPQIPLTRKSTRINHTPHEASN
jgi:hypothetical protein